MKDHKMCVERSDIIEILDGRLETVNIKLDFIKEQTTRTNGRVTEVERKVHDMEVGDAARYTSCPQLNRIQAIESAVISHQEMKKLVIKGISIAGIFFTILFGLVTLILRYNII